MLDTATAARTPAPATAAVVSSVRPAARGVGQYRESLASEKVAEKEENMAFMSL